MKIGLIDVDGHNFPNLALMKISAYHKAQGDDVEWCVPILQYDIVYQSKVFDDTYSQDISFVPQADEIIKGGTGYGMNNKLPDEMEHIYPDYSLYPELTKDTAFGFLTRGCCNNCSFCIVCEKEGRCSQKVADLSEFWRGQKNIKLLDPNLLACPDKKELLQQLIDSKAKIDFTQGLDARFINDEIAKLICKCKIDIVHFAFDLMENEKAIRQGLECFKEHYKGSDRALKVYVITNYNTTHQEDWYRVKCISELGYHPYVMIYQKGTHDRFLTDLQRYCNSPFLFRSTSFEDYVPRSNGKSCKELYSSILRIENEK